MHEIARIAEEWKDTPFVWQGRVKGVGCDCKGLIAGVAREAGRPEAESVEALAGDYGSKVPVARLKAGLARLFDKVAEPAAGDVVLLKIGGKAQHLALVGTSGRHIVHCYPGGPARVVIAPYGTAYRALTDSIWRWRNAPA
jgi:cell wall-associated NlpC family hydrolase